MIKTLFDTTNAIHNLETVIKSIINIETAFKNILTLKAFYNEGLSKVNL